MARHVIRSPRHDRSAESNMTLDGMVHLHLGGEESSLSARIREVSNPNTDTYGELKLNTPGDQLLYHYTTADTAFGYILPTGTLPA